MGNVSHSAVRVLTGCSPLAQQWTLCAVAHKQTGSLLDSFDLCAVLCNWTIVRQVLQNVMMP